MKNQTLLLLILLFFVSSCKHDDGVAALLLRAENLMEFSSDSALLILRQLPSPEKLRGSQQADYALLMAQAMDKNYLLLTSDSLISVALHFYQNSNNVLQKGLCYYYLDQKRIQLWVSLFMISLLLLLLLFLCRYYHTYRERKENEKKQLENRLRQNEMQLTEAIAKNQQLESDSNQLKLLSRTNKSVTEEEYRQIEAFRLYEALVDCSQKSNCHNSADWELLFLWADMSCQKFYSRLKQAYPSLKKRDLQICCLIKLGFSNDDMRLIFDIQQRTLYTDKNNTKHRLDLKEGVRLENWLSSY